ncbi:MAG: DEAD/DEAH box helicase [Desulfobacteraceae bacterium]|jgi:SNF2 family DNA or RNA helicase
MNKFVPKDYQVEDIDFLSTARIGGLFEEMGLGKTVVVLKTIEAAMFDFVDTEKTLVVSTKNVILNQWPQEIKKWDFSSNFSFTILHGEYKQQNLLLKKQIYLINYDGLYWLNRQYRNKRLWPILPKFDMVVIDESTHIKNDQSQRSQIIQQLFGLAKRKIILTGTPTPNGLIDLYGQICFLNDRVLGTNLTSFRNNYFISVDGGHGGYKYVPRQGSRDLITKRIAHLVKIRKAADHLEKEEVRINKIECNFDDKIQEEYDTLESDFFLELDDQKVEVFSAASLSSKLRQYTQGFLYGQDKKVSQVNDTKHKVLKEILEYSTGHPILCGIQFIAEVDLIRKFLGYNVPAINSKTSDRDTAKYIEQWNNRQLPLLIAHPQSIAHGINLQSGGNIILWLGLPWAMDHYQQFIGRLDRQGQKNGVIVHHLIVKKTIDEAIMAALESKVDTQNRVIDSIQKYRDEKENIGKRC